MNGIDAPIGPTRALIVARDEVTRTREAYTQDRTQRNLDAWNAALARYNVAREQAREARLLAERECEEPERWDGQS